MINKEDAEFIVKRMNNLIEMDDLVVNSVKEIEMILLNLKITAAHLGEAGKRSGITPICDTLKGIAEKMEEQAKVYKKERIKAQDLEKKLKVFIKNSQ